MGKRIFQYPEVTELAEDDYIMIDSEADDTRCILASKIAPSLMSKTVTERKVYNASEDGVKGYSSVDVKVPFTNITDLEGDVVTFDDGEDLPLASLKTTIVPIQSGSGDPSPSNVRPISGWSGANISVVGDNWGDCEDLTEPKTSDTWYNVKLLNNTYTISFDVVNAVRTGLGNASVFGIYNNGTTKYILASNIYSVVDNSTYQSKGTNVSGRFYFTYTGKIEVLIAYWRSNSYQLLTSGSLENIMIEVGNNPTKQYTPYNGHTYNIPFTDSQGNPIEVFGGELDVVNGGGTSERVKRTLDGSENWDVNNNCFTMYIADIKQSQTTSSTNLIVISDSYKAVGVKYRDSITEGGIAKTVGANTQIAIRDSNYTTVEDWKAHLSQNPIQIVYELATPTTFQTQPTSIKSLEGTNNVWGDCGKSLVSYQKTWVQPDFTPDNN